MKAKEQKQIEWLKKLDSQYIVVYRYSHEFASLSSCSIQYFLSTKKSPVDILSVTDGKTYYHPDPAIFADDQPEPKDKALQEYLEAHVLEYGGDFLAAQLRNAMREFNERIKALEAANEL